MVDSDGWISTESSGLLPRFPSGGVVGTEYGTDQESLFLQRRAPSVESTAPPGPAAGSHPYAAEFNPGRLPPDVMENIWTAVVF